MIGTIALLLGASLAAQPPVDTTLSVGRGSRLRVEVRDGRVDIGTWDRDEVRVVAEGDERDVSVRGGGSSVYVEAEPRSHDRENRYRITVPVWMDARVETRQADVTVDGVQGAVDVNSVGGSIDVRGARNSVDLETVQGSIRVRDVRGRVNAENVGQGIELDDVQGDVSVVSVNGGIELRRVDSGSVEAETVNGGVLLEGRIRPSGYYHLTSHNGEVRLVVPEQPDAEVTVSTFNGAFDSAFPVAITSAGKEIHFVLGSGSAHIELESFNGTITLGRSGPGSN